MKRHDLAVLQQLGGGLPTAFLCSIYSIQSQLKRTHTASYPPGHLCAQQVSVKEAPKPIYRKDYRPPPYLIDTVKLNFNLNEDVTTVTSRLAMVPNYAPGGAPPPLFLHGRPDVKLVSVSVSGIYLHEQPLVALQGVVPRGCQSRSSSSA